MHVDRGLALGNPVQGVYRCLCKVFFQIWPRRLREVGQWDRGTASGSGKVTWTIPAPQ